ncbi:MAG: riboflavin synthase [Actinomycetota bacterium]|nr:riboflavin synthase [Actinomycetota bacterium]
MFTGIVATGGQVKGIRRKGRVLELTVEAPTVARELSEGDSVAVNGVCLTAVEAGRRRFKTEVVDETLARSTLGGLRKGDVVNLELAARLVDRIGGHLVQGHVDGTVRLARIEEESGSRRLWWEADDDVLRYIVMKGSVALDGVSLTVAGVGPSTFEVAVIPHTLEVTTLGRAEVGDVANVEVDLIAKYVERLTDVDSPAESVQDNTRQRSSRRSREQKGAR